MALDPLGPRRPPRFWPDPPAPPGRSVIVAVTATVAVAAISVYPLSNGPGWFLTGLALAALAAAAGRGRGRARSWAYRLDQIGWTVAALALLAVGFIRDSGFLFLACLAGAFGCGALAVTGGRHLRAIVVGVAMVVPAGLRSGSWWARSAKESVAGRSMIRGVWTVLAVAVLVLVFGGLFVSADPAFARLVHTGAFQVDGREVGRGLIATLLVTPIALGVGYLGSASSRLETVAPVRIGRVRRSEWAFPLGVLDLLFLSFVLVQLTVLFGGRDRVRQTAGLTYAQYARSGFWQLLVVAGLTVAVIGVVLKIAPNVARADRVLLRFLLGVLALLTLVIVASALHRMAIYDQAYGYTRLRLSVSATEIWLGVVFVLILAACVRLDAGWVPRVALACAVVTLLSVAGLNPDRFIAERNVSRYRETGLIDLNYLCHLSADAVPALLDLRVDQRQQATFWVQQAPRDGWRSWNLGAARARHAVADAGSADPLPCWSAQRLGQ